MIRKFMMASALALATAAPAGAATFSVSFPTSPGLQAVSGNDFSGLFSLINFVSTGAGISLDANASIDFFYLGAESGYTNTFTAGSGPGSISYTESDLSGPVFLGSLYYAAGDILDWSFTSGPGQGTAASISQDGFGIFLAGGPSPATGLTSLIIGYDDQQQISGDDDNHDDLIILAQISSVPEASTWAMLIAGFVTVGAALRRRSSLRIRQAV